MPNGPRDLLDVVDRLTFLQVDPTAVIAPAADHVAWSRLGDRYDPAQLTAALERDRTLFEHKAQPTFVEGRIVMIRPMADLPLYLAEMAEMPPPRFYDVRAFLDANDGFRRRILDQLHDAGPLMSREIPDTSETSWQSSGWTHERNVTQMLEGLAWRGEVAVSARRGRERLWDLPERVFPAGVDGAPGRGGSPAARRALAARARDRAAEVRRRGGDPGDGRGHQGCLAPGPGGVRRGLRRPNRASSRRSTG